MLGLMQEWPLTVDRILDHAAKRHGDREIVTRSIAGPIVRTNYATVHARAKRVSNALLAAGIVLGDRVATLAFNTDRHLEAYYGIMSVGAVCHTLNPRLHPDQIAWIIGHAEDRIVLVDPPFVALVVSLLDRCPSVEAIVVLGGDAQAGLSAKIPVLSCEDWIAGHGTECAWGGFAENTAAGLCYTSGTTGDPKGVLYSHRSNFLHTFMVLTADVMGLSQADVVLPVVPMFHANGWGVAFSAPAVGAKLVMPGAKMDGASIYELLETEGVTFSAAVPTVWQMLLAHLDMTGERITTLKRVVIGGAAVPEMLIRAFWDRHGVEVLQGWGMTETSPLGTVSKPLAAIAGLSFEEQVPVRMKQGRPALGIELKVSDDLGATLPEDGKSVGNLRVRGGIVARAYFRNPQDILDTEGYFDTGDVATLDPDGFMQITDRAKDVIKSGGEWISSVDIENIATGHEKASIAAVIGLPHPKWDERPLLLVKLKPGVEADAAEFVAFLDGKIAKWWMPDEILFVEDIPLGATGKIDKKVLRRRYEGHVFATRD